MRIRKDTGGLGLLLALCAFLAGNPLAAWAQGAYKTVDPDGRVTYSDGPPAGTDGQSSTVDVTPATGAGNIAPPPPKASQGSLATPSQGTRRTRVITALPPERAPGLPPERPAQMPAADTRRAPILPPAVPRPTSLDVVTPDVVRGALAGTALIALPYPPQLAGAPSAECPDSRRFAVFRRTPPAEDETKGRPASTFSHDLAVSLCRSGPLGPGTYRALFASSAELVRQIAREQPAIGAQLGQRSATVGGREALVAPIAVMGHGVTVTPLGVIDGRVAGYTIVASIDDTTAHIGEAGRLTMKDALDEIEAVLRAADAVIAR